MAFVIAAPASNSGKTLLSILIASWTRRKNKSLQTFKAGPDYLDPQLLSAVSARPCRNLDPILCGKDWVKNSFNHFIDSAELGFIEGVMGLFDGIGSSSKGSTAEIAKLLNLPVLMIVDAHGQASSIAALVKGFCDFDKEVKIAGVVLNKVNSSRHRDLLTHALKEINIKVLGCIPQNESLLIKSKNLGLQPAHEITDLNKLIELWSNLAEKYLDIKSISQLLKNDKSSNISKEDLYKYNDLKAKNKKNITIAIAQDKAFHFRYSETKDYLNNIGIQTIDWGLINDETIPKEATGLIIPGGFPEQFAEEISHCKKSLKSIKDFFMRDPIYAECGGMLLLGDSIANNDGKAFPMAGLLPFKSKESNLQIGYRKLKPISNGLISKKGEILIGHEFHRWELETLEINQAYMNYQITSPWELSGWGVDTQKEGWCNRLLHASWIHLHWPSSPNIINRWLCSFPNNK